MDKPMFGAVPEWEAGQLLKALFLERLLPRIAYEKEDIFLC